MVAFSMDELARSLGEDKANFAKNMANEAANFACGLYKDFPGSIIKNPADSFLRGFWDTLCDKRPPGLPTPPSPDFQGGQCPVYYALAFESHTGYNDGTDRPILGAISGIEIAHMRHPQFGSWAWYFLVSAPRVLNADFINGKYWITASTSFNFPDPRPPKPIMRGLTRIDGQPDNCGNPPPTNWYPVVPIPTDRQSTVITNVYNDSTNIKIPLTYAPISGQFGVNINVGGVNVGFDLGGVTFDFGFDSSQPGQQIDDKITNVQNNVKNIENYFHYYPQPPSDNGFDTIVIPDMPSGKVDADEELQWILIELTNVPKNAKIQHGGNAQDVLYAGWFQFMVGDFCLPREPIHFKKSIFKRPPGATAYSFTLYTGFKASLKEYRSKPISDSL